MQKLTFPSQAATSNRPEPRVATAFMSRGLVLTVGYRIATSLSTTRRQQVLDLVFAKGGPSPPLINRCPSYPQRRSQLQRGIEEVDGVLGFHSRDSKHALIFNASIIAKHSFILKP